MSFLSSAVRAVVVCFLFAVASGAAVPEQRLDSTCAASIGGVNPAWRRAPRILFVGNFDADREALLASFQRAQIGVVPTWIPGLAEVETALQSKWDLVISADDPQTQFGSHVVATVRRLRPGMPVLLLLGSSPADRARLDELMLAGAADCLHRDDPRLVYAVARELQSRHRLRRWHRAHQARVSKAEAEAALFDSSPTLLYIGTTDGRTSRVNPAYRALLGYEHRELMTLDLMSIIHQEDRLRLSEKPRTSAPQPPADHHLELRMLRKDGTYVRVSWTVTFLGKDQSILFAEGRDMTYADTRVATTRDTERVAALAVLSQSIAHNFNNQLAVIMGFGELLRELLPEASEARAMLGDVLGAAENARDLVSRISRFNRQRTPNLQPIRLSEIVEDSIGSFRSSVPGIVEFIGETAPNERPVSADRAELHEAATAIASNFAYAIRESQARSRIALSVEPVFQDGSVKSPDGFIPPGDYMRLRFRDLDNAIQPEVLQRVVEAYFATKAVDVSAGLGLLTAHDIVRTQQGWIILDQPAEGGARFDIYLPALPVAPTTAAPVQAAASPMAGEFRSGAGIHVLLAEDDPAVRALSRTFLTRIGYQVTIAENGQKAWELFQANPDDFHFVLTDMTMPLMTGLGLAEHIRAAGSKVPILLLTGNSGAVSAQVVQSMGRLEVLVKTGDRREFLRAVERGLDSPVPR